MNTYCTAEASNGHKLSILHVKLSTSIVPYIPGMQSTAFWQMLLHHVSALQDGTTPLHLAAYSGKAEAVQLLISNGASVHAQNCDCQTPLFEAAAAGHCAAAEVLVQHGADAGEGPTPNTSPFNVCLLSLLVCIQIPLLIRLTSGESFFKGETSDTPGAVQVTST